MKSYWREKAAPLIAQVLKATSGQDERTIQRALTDAYPFGERKSWPYKAWLNEVRAQRGRQRERPAPEGQQNLFED